MIPCHSAELCCLYYRIQHDTMPLSRTVLPVLQDTTCYHATQLNCAACTTGYNMIPCHSAELCCLYYRIQHATMPLSRTVLPVLQDTTCYHATQPNCAACTTGYNMIPCHSAELCCLYYRIQHATMPLS